MGGFKLILQEYNGLPINKVSAEQSNSKILFGGHIAGVPAYWFEIESVTVSRLQIVLQYKFDLLLNPDFSALLIWFRRKPPIKCQRCSNAYEDSKRFLHIIESIEEEYNEIDCKYNCS